MQHRRDLSPVSGAIRRARDRRSDRNEVTDIIPIDEFINGFAALDALAFDDAAFDDLDFDDAALDDLDFDDAPQLVEAAELQDLPDSAFALTPASPPVTTDLLPGAAVRRAGQHRKQVSGPVKGRILITAVAAGAVAAAAHSAINPTDTASAEVTLAADQVPPPTGDGGSTPRGIQVISVKPAATFAVHDEELAKGVAFAQERAEREARLQRPLFVAPTKGLFTSNFGYRWGALHAGIDIANSIGTPIAAASDGVVIEAGSSAGYGMLVKVRHSDGTVTLYGHVNTTTVSAGERVMAGDQIATMGNRGFSTGPHLHFEVLLNGTSRVDPLPWLAKRGIGIGDLAG